MRYLNWLPVAVAALVLAGGCSSSREKARRKLAEKLDEARRRYDHATALTDYPYYRDASSGVRSPVYRKLGEHIDVPATRPAIDDRPLKVLDDAEKALAEALSDVAGKAPDTIKSDAELLLGKICLARGRHRAHVAEVFRSDAARERQAAGAMLDGLYSRLAAVEDNKAIAGMSRKKIVAKQDGLNKQVQALAGKIDASDKQIAKLVREIDALNKDSATRRPEAQKFRDRSELTTGPKGLALLTDAQAIEAKINANAGQVAAKQQAMVVLRKNKALLDKEHGLVKAELAEINRHLKAIGDRSDQAAAAATTAQAEVAKFAGEILAEARAAEEACRKARGREKQALADFEKALKHFSRAAAGVEAQVRSARTAGKQEKGGIQAVLADDQHLASVLSLKASASLAMAELRSRQLTTAGANTALAGRITKAWNKLAQLPPITEEWKKLAQSPPAVAAALSGYLADAGNARKEAKKNYQAAEADLEKIDEKYLLAGNAENIKWIYQGSLAAAYLGHYRLTGEQAILKKANDLVDEALKDKDRSPYLESVRRLRKLIPPVGK